MSDLHWAEWAWLGFAVVLLAAFALKTLLLHRSVRTSEEPVELGSLAASPPRRREAPIEVSDEQRCPCCHGDLALQEGLHRCSGCSTVLHWECFREFGCPTLGCERSFRSRAEPPTDCGDDEPSKPPVKETA
jgi:hypothetical protein